MINDVITIQNDGLIVQSTNYFDTAQAKRGEVYLTWNAGCGRLLVPTSQRHLVQEMRCNKVIVTQQKLGIHILFDDGSDAPFRLVIAHEQNDRQITAGECLFSVYIKLGEKYQFPGKCIIEHGNVGNKNAKKHEDVAHVHFKTSMNNKTKWVAQAQKQGFKNLSDFIIYKVNL